MLKEMTRTYIVAAIVAAVMFVAPQASADDIDTAIKQNPGRSPAWLAEQTGLSEDAVVEALVGKYRIPVSPDKFDEVWAKETLTGALSPIAQAILSMPWMNCSTMWSPLSQVKYSQLRIWYSISDHSGERPRCQRPPVL